jgi:hypothetical protein
MPAKGFNPYRLVALRIGCTHPTYDPQHIIGQPRLQTKQGEQQELLFVIDAMLNFCVHFSFSQRGLVLLEIGILIALG